VIDVALRPTEVRVAELAIVIDVLRATTTATQALASGYRRVLCVESIERAEALRAPGRVLAGERSCVKPSGFDQGNSPIEALEPVGEELVLTTTNGTPAVTRASGQAENVLLACMLNLGATVRATLAHLTAGALEVQIVCAGTDGGVSLEDAYVAGRISRRLPGPRTDAARVAEAVARAFPTPLEALSAGADAWALEAAEMGDDVAFCAQESVLDVVPLVANVDAGMAIVTLGDGAARPAGARAADGLDTVGR
jgi:2-phosphosulfolactate phosphatase